MQSLRILLHGASGRMGHALLGLAAEFPQLQLLPYSSRTDKPADDFDLLIDFSLPPGLLVAARLAMERHVPLLSGTTGLGEEHECALDGLAEQVAVLQASNFSLGLAALRRAAADLARRLDWDCEIVESHHRHKRDAPSGTALTLAEAICSARGQPLAWQDRIADSESAKERSAGSLGIASLRGGAVVGDHTVHFLGPGERIECSHRADDRAIFARGALHAATLLATRPAGRYSLDQVLWS